MKRTIAIWLVAVATVITGCEKKLEITPATVSPEELILSTVDGLNGGLSFAYQAYHNNAGRTFTLWSELLSDQLLLRGTNTLPNHVFFYNRDLDAIVSETVNSTDFRKTSDIKLRELYVPANTCALILRACRNDLAAGDIGYASNKNRIMGECHFLRAACYLELVRFWALPWGATADNSHPGVVVNDEPVADRESQVKSRSSVAEVYDFIIKDLLEAERLLPDTYITGEHSALYEGRAYKDAARGYLARIYFQQRNYTKAKEMINVLIGTVPGNLSNHQLQASLTQLFSTRGASNTDPECIYQTTSSTAITSSLATWWNSTNTESVFSRSASIEPKGIATLQFFADAKFAAQDQRFTLFKTLADGRVSPTKYSLVDHFNIPLLRSAEMVLDRAEINALDNQLDAAIDDCNAIRSRAQISLLSMPMTQEQLLDSIRTDRIRELCFEGDRFNNLRRLQLPFGPGERTGVQPIPWNSKNLVLKYTEEDMARNPLLVNNY